MAIKNIVFDLGGVLLNLDMQRTHRAFENIGVKDVAALFNIGHAASYFKDYEVGAITDNEFVQAIKKHGGLNVEDAAVIDAWNALLLDFPEERIELLRKLKDKYRIFLFSNTNAIHLDDFRRKYTNAYGGSLDDHFEIAWYSHLIGLRKPSVESFQYILNDGKLDAAETMFIDDALVNVEGANATGIKGVHLEPGKTILDLGLL
ncbi:MAG: HAD family phosphatase [Chitinophagaceae bacterium]